VPDTKKLIMGFQQENPRLYEAFREVDKDITNIKTQSGFGAGGRAYARVYSNVGISVPVSTPGVATYIPFNSEWFKNALIHDTVTNNSKIFVVRSGWYNIGANIRIPVAAAGTNISIGILLNQTRYICSDSAIADGINFTDLTIHCGWVLNESDFVELGVAHNDPAGFTVPSIPGVSPELWISET
jgi:hypothetical protein